MKHGVLKHLHPMIGRDLHIPWPPGSPTPAPAPAPYATFQILMGTSLTAKYSSTAFSDYMGYTMLQGTDIGPMIPHIGPPSLTLPVEMLLSASKSLFGVANYQVDQKPIAASLLFVMNPNLNCGTPCPTPFGAVLALTTHRVDMTMGDICGGMARMLTDVLIQVALNKLGGFIGDKLFAGIVKGFGERVFFNALLKYVAPETRFAVSEALALTRYSEWLGQVYRLTGPAAGFFLGGPLGPDSSVIGVPPANALAGKPLPGDDDLSTQGENAADRAGRALGDYLDAKFPGDDGPGDFPAPSASAFAG